MDDILQQALDSAEPPAAETTTADPAEQSGESAAAEESAPDTEATAKTDPQRSLLQPNISKFKIEDETSFGDAELATPEAMREARLVLQAKRRENHSKYLELQKRETRFKSAKAETLQLRDNLRAQFGALQNDIQALRQGDADTVMGALSRLSGGRNAAELFEELSLNLARNGKRAPSAEVTELRGELAEMKRILQQREQTDQQREQQAHVNQARREILTVTSDAASFPILAHFSKENPQGVADDVARYIIQQNQNGVTLDYKSAASHIESELRKKFQAFVPQVASPQGADAGRETGASANPGVPQVGKTIAPSLATQSSGISRAATEAELLKKAAQELPSDFWAQFGMQ